MRYQVRFGTYQSKAYGLHSSHNDLLDAGIEADKVIDDEPGLFRIWVVDTQAVSTHSGAPFCKFHTIKDIDWVMHGAIEKARRKRIYRSKK